MKHFSFSTMWITSEAMFFKQLSSKRLALISHFLKYTASLYSQSLSPPPPCMIFEIYTNTNYVGISSKTRLKKKIFKKLISNRFLFGKMNFNRWKLYTRCYKPLEKLSVWLVRTADKSDYTLCFNQYWRTVRNKQ